MYEVSLVRNAMLIKRSIATCFGVAVDIPFSLDQTPRLLFISAINFMRFLFESGAYLTQWKVSVNNTCTKSTGISTDGTKDDEIHCLKEGGAADDARESGKSYTANPTSLHQKWTM